MTCYSLVDIYAFVILKDGVKDSEEDIIKDLQQLVKKHIGGFAVPQLMLVNIGTSTNINGCHNYPYWFLDCARLA